jgi:hypothetical protein
MGRVVPENFKDPEQKGGSAGYLDAFNLRLEKEVVEIKG